MSTTTLPQPDVVARPPRRVGFQFIGQARVLRQQLLAGDERYQAAVEKMIHPLLARSRRYPKRLQREQDLTDVARAFARLEDVHRIRWHVDVPAKRQLVVTDYRASSSEWFDERWEDPEWQSGIAITKFRLAVAERVEAEGVVITNIALHGIARFYERGGRTDIDSLREELAPLITSTARIHVPTPQGYWRGDVVRARDRAGHKFPSRSVRTWISHEMIEDLPAAAIT
jgi:hypothetical protein